MASDRLRLPLDGYGREPAGLWFRRLIVVAVELLDLVGSVSSESLRREVQSAARGAGVRGVKFGDCGRVQPGLGGVGPRFGVVVGGRLLGVPRCSCGSLLRCPWCSVRGLSAGSGLRLEVDWHGSRVDLSPGLWSAGVLLSFEHGRGDRFEVLVPALVSVFEGWLKRVRNGVNAVCRRVGMRARFAVQHHVWSPEGGPHPHIHVAFVFDGDSGGFGDWLSWVAGLWVEEAARVGRRASRAVVEGGVLLESLQRAANYYLEHRRTPEGSRYSEDEIRDWVEHHKPDRVWWKDNERDGGWSPAWIGGIPVLTGVAALSVLRDRVAFRVLQDYLRGIEALPAQRRTPLLDSFRSLRAFHGVRKADVQPAAREIRRRTDRDPDAFRVPVEVVAMLERTEGAHRADSVALLTGCVDAVEAAGLLSGVLDVPFDVTEGPDGVPIVGRPVDLAGVPATSEELVSA